MAEKACGQFDPGCAVGNWVSGLADDAINNLAKAIMEGMSQMVTTLSTFWVSMPTVNLASQDGTTPSPVVSAVNSELMPWTLTLAVLAVILGGIRMIWEQRGAPLKDLLRSLHHADSGVGPWPGCHLNSGDRGRCFLGRRSSSVPRTGRALPRR